MTFVEMKKKRGMKQKDAESGENWQGPCSAQAARYLTERMRHVASSCINYDVSQRILFKAIRGTTKPRDVACKRTKIYILRERKTHPQNDSFVRNYVLILKLIN